MQTQFGAAHASSTRIAADEGFVPAPFPASGEMRRRAVARPTLESPVRRCWQPLLRGDSCAHIRSAAALLGLVLLALTAVGSASAGLPVTPAVASIPRRPSLPRQGGRHRRAHGARHHRHRRPDGDPSVQRPPVAAVAEPARISCAKSNCTKGPTTATGRSTSSGPRATRSTPPGRGCCTSGNSTPAARPRATDIEAGTWVWVDHGGGGITKYNHLDSIMACEGQLVTPATRDRLDGAQGRRPPCTTNYLHFEVRAGGVTGARVNPGTCSMCSARPAGIRCRTPWGSRPGTTPCCRTVKLNTPAATSTCITTPGARRPATPVPASGSGLGRPACRGTRRRRARTGWWSSRSCGARACIAMAGRRTSSSSAHRPGAGPSVGLTNGRTYRYRVAFHNAYGNSAWSTPAPSSLPRSRRPRRRRASSPPRRVTYIHYGWWKSADNGSAVTSYRAARRCLHNGSYGPWAYTVVAPTVYYTNFRGLAGITACQVKVRAANRVGNSGWSEVSSIRKRA